VWKNISRVGLSSPYFGRLRDVVYVYWLKGACGSSGPKDSSSIARAKLQNSSDLAPPVQAVYDPRMPETLPSTAEAWNPAQLSAQLTALFPAGVVGAELRQPADPALLSPEEMQCVSHCATKRILDFTAGRLCARRALQELGVGAFSLLSADDRQPVWPASIAGSITHTEHYSAAVVARRRDIRSLGVDSQAIPAVQSDLWSRICTPGELARLQRFPPDRRMACAALIFAAKEAFYKCQFPLVREWLDFEEVVIETDAWDNRSGAFRVLPQRRILLDAQVTAAITGRFRFHEQFVTAGIALPV
jgi:4'-phosphopantetheinyl transferase EntD